MKLIGVGVRKKALKSIMFFHAVNATRDILKTLNILFNGIIIHDKHLTIQSDLHHDIFIRDIVQIFHQMFLQDLFCLISIDFPKVHSKFAHAEVEGLLIPVDDEIDFELLKGLQKEILMGD